MMTKVSIIIPIYNVEMFLKECLESVLQQASSIATSYSSTVKQAKQGGKLQSVLSKIILPYDQLKGLYPILTKKKWLTPVFQIIRWFRLLDPARWNRSVNFLKSSMNTHEERAKAMSTLMQELEIQ